MPDKHCRYSPSASSRWLACPASLNHDKPDEPSASALEGTAAHHLAERCWLLGVEASTFLGSEIDGFVVDQEMVDGVQIYLDCVQSTLQELGPTATVWTEQFMESSMSPDFGGTIDCLIQTPDQAVLIDFKYGFQPVEVVGNTQLLCYATMVPGVHNKRVRLCIVQPRAHHDEGPVRSWEVPELRVAAFALQVRGAIEDGPSEKFSAGDHCQWCPRRSDCPELYTLATECAAKAFDRVDADPVEHIAEILDKSKAIKIYLKAVEDTARLVLESGGEVPGYKLVNAFGNRRYAVDEAIVEKKCKSKGFGKKQIFETKILSPAQLEKVVGKELVGSLCERPLNGTTVVPESDRRPAVERQTPQQMFEEIE